MGTEIDLIGLFKTDDTWVHPEGLGQNVTLLDFENFSVLDFIFSWRWITYLGDSHVLEKTACRLGAETSSGGPPSCELITWSPETPDIFMTPAGFN